MPIAYVRVIPIVTTLPLDVRLNITQFLQIAPPGTLVTMLTFVYVDSTIVLTMAYGANVQAKRVYQGQCFTFGSVGECVGVMAEGIYLGSDIAVVGGTVQLEICTIGAGAVAEAIASQ